MTKKEILKKWKVTPGKDLTQMINDRWQKTTPWLKKNKYEQDDIISAAREIFNV